MAALPRHAPYSTALYCTLLFELTRMYWENVASSSRLSWPEASAEVLTEVFPTLVANPKEADAEALKPRNPPLAPVCEPIHGGRGKGGGGASVSIPGSKGK